MATGTADAQAEEDSAGRVDSFDDVAGVDFLGDGAAFVGGDVTTIEAGRHLLMLTSDS